jgi:hypothetical protein
VDSSGNALTYNGRSWSAPTKIAAGNELESVSCSSASFCVAVGRVDDTASAQFYNGRSWSAPEAIDESDEKVSVSCSSATFCTAVQTNGTALIYNGSSWSAPDQIDDVEGNWLESVSCSSATFCAAVDEMGNAMLYDGSSWGAPDNIKGGSITGFFGSDSVSCPSASFCVAVDGGGNAQTFNGHSWSAPNYIAGKAIGPDDSSGEPGQSVSCSSASFCAAIFDALPIKIVKNEELPVPICACVIAVIYKGGSWSAPIPILLGGDGDPVAVSCASEAFCVAVKNDGTALTYTATVSQAKQVAPVKQTGSVVPVNTLHPTIRGKARARSKLVATQGRWRGTLPMSYSYRWKHCNKRAKRCQVIPGATKKLLLISSKYVGSRLQVVVTATNAAGRVSAVSRAGAVVKR